MAFFINTHIKRSVLYLLHCSWRLLRCFDEKVLSRRACPGERVPLPWSGGTLGIHCRRRRRQRCFIAPSSSHSQTALFFSASAMRRNLLGAAGWNNGRSKCQEAIHALCFMRHHIIQIYGKLRDKLSYHLIIEGQIDDNLG